ncbi:DUF4097 family beta strand repeat-containing protein [Actinoplanes sp. NPDC051343]|uniref:DUF4097 family beta strand repeat-containing protein n=1 Tax=Actinoplanes sp. NPDC051343 TaxID=3363906 RepID=UPI0037937C1D
MPTFDSPGPITARLQFSMVIANVRVVAEPRSDVEVEVTPVDPGRKADVRVAEQTKIEFADGILTARAPRLGSLLTRTGAVDVHLRMPEGSGLTGETAMGEIVTEGPLGEVRFKAAYGDVRIAKAETVHLRCSSGDVSVGEAGSAEVVATNGGVDIGRVDGPVKVSNGNGGSRIGEASGEIEVNGANGVVTIDRALGDVVARNANGRIEIGEVVRGTVTMTTAAGSLEVGVREGSAAWLDLNTVAGKVRNELLVGGAPADGENSVTIRARTHVGNIVVRRAG